MLDVRSYYIINSRISFCKFFVQPFIELKVGKGNHEIPIAANEEIKKNKIYIVYIVWSNSRFQPFIELDVGRETMKCLLQLMRKF